MLRRFSTGLITKQKRFNIVRPPLDYKFIAQNAEVFEKSCRDRNVDVSRVRRVVDLYTQNKRHQTSLDKLLERRNQLAFESVDAATRERTRQEASELKEKIAAVEAERDASRSELLQEALKLPNIAHADAPVGDEDASRIVVQVGEPRVFGFRPRSHIEIGARHRWFDFEAGTAVSGPKFVFLRREAVLLEMALVQWALNELQSRGFELTLPPDVVHTSTAAACGYQPRGVASQVYTLSSHGVGDTRSSHDDSDEQSLCLVGTSEIPLTAQFAGRVLDASRLPLRCAAFGHCFRAEAGAGGLAAGGLYRLHQFSKVEMVVLANAKHSDAVLEELVHIQRDLYASLGLSFRIRDMATGDLGAAAQRKFDLEAWMPSRNAWGELCSASNCTDYQSRRLNVRASDTTQQGARPEYVHTLNATAMAAPRVMLALIEQHQTADGRVAVPAPLRPYLNARTHLP